MTVNRRKKNSRQRRSWTHGWGSKKKHRGAGNRGGRGMSGTGKRADSKKPSIWKKRYFGKHGFASINRKKIVTQNTGYLEQNLDVLLAKGAITKENDFYVVSPEKSGFNKLLGRGKVSHKFRVAVPHASGRAIEIIKNAGGIVVTETASEDKKEE